MKKDELINLVQSYLNRYEEDVHALRVLDFLNNTDLFWQRENREGHITASAWVLNESRDQALLTHHVNLKVWCQLGGHIEEGDIDIFDASLRELIEESGMNQFRRLSDEIFDIDVHLIPESKKGVPAHFHYDIRILFESNDKQAIHFDKNESNEVRWFKYNEISDVTLEDSIKRMIAKSLNL